MWWNSNRKLNGYLQGELTVISRAENSRKRAEMLQDMHYRSLIAFEKHLSSTFFPFRNISQRLVLLRRWESLIFPEPYCVKTIAERKRRPNISSRLNFKQAMVLPKSSPSWRIWWALPSVGFCEHQSQCSFTLLLSGAHGANIQQARKIDGIINVELIEDSCTFKVVFNKIYIKYYP